MPEGAILPTVSVIVVNYRGTDDTISCLRALRADVDYPADRLQLVCVDNGSDPGDAELIAAAVPGITMVESPTNLGFAAGCNLGARHATGTVLGLLNNDARPDRNWVRAAVAVLRTDPTVASVASKVLDWSGERVDFVDAGMSWFGMGFKPNVGRPVGDLAAEDHELARDVLFATGSAMFVRADVFAEAGGFDERFFMFYEDVDLGWRLNLRGWRVRYQPTSIAYHRHHASMATVDGPDRARETFLLERNALAALYKNLSDETLARALPAALALAVRRATAHAGLDPNQLDIGREHDDADVTIPRTALAGILGIDRFVELLAELGPARAAVQSTRVRTDADLVPLMRKPLEPINVLPRYLDAHARLVEAFGIDEAFGRPRRIVVLTADAITARMAGPAIRAWHIAHALAGDHDVRLVTVSPHGERLGAPFPILSVPQRDLPEQVDWADVVVLQGPVLEMVPELKRPDSRTAVVCDMYDPMHLELLEQGREATDEQRAKDLLGVTAMINAQLRRGDFFLCASQRQRHFWLGHLAALGRLTPRLYDADPTAASLLTVVPFGLPDKPPTRTGAGPRGTLAGIAERDRVILWAGGVYSWFDPLTLVRAMAEVGARRPDARLVFLGMRHPNPDIPEMDIAARTRALADELDVTGRHVFFNEGWVPYADRQNWLLDADCGVTTHFEHVETTFAFRTRVLDYLWAGLPIVTTDGDSFADLVRAERLGVVVPPADRTALAAALERVLYDAEFAAECRARIDAVRERFTWTNVLAPLVEYCRSPRLAADRLSGAGHLVADEPLGATGVLRRDVGLVRDYLAMGGPAEVARRAMGRLRRLALGQVPGRVDGAP